MGLTVNADIEVWTLAEPFVISRGSKTHATVVVATISDGASIGRGECVPYTRYGEAPESTKAAIVAAASAFADDCVSPATARAALSSLLPPGAARNALDCALWDLEAQTAGGVAKLAGVTPPSEPVLTAFTLSLDTPDAMAAKARSLVHLPLLKLKLGGDDDEARLLAVRSARPDARLIADANEAWRVEQLNPLMAAAEAVCLEMVEQPLPAGEDAALSSLGPLVCRKKGPRRADGARSVAICADESVHTRADLPALVGRYDAINVKLDKAGGLTEALALTHEARRLGLDVMVGSMVSTSLAVAPALLLAPVARWVDLDGPLLLARDRSGGLDIRDGLIGLSPGGIGGSWQLA